MTFFIVTAVKTSKKINITHLFCNQPSARAEIKPITEIPRM
jgi:hypothetical protein